MNIKHKSTLEKLENYLRFKKYSERTIEVYVWYAESFLNAFNKDLYHISQSEANKYLHSRKYTSSSQQNQYISAVKLLYKHVLRTELNVLQVERPRKEHKLPQIIDKNYLLQCIEKIENKKHKALISLGYSVGLRVSEVINLKITDIDSKRMVITIRNAKGRKDRIAPLSEKLLQILRDYFKEYRPVEYLFNGQTEPQYTSSSCNAIVRKYIGESYHWHLLRHSCLTSTLESGGDLRSIQMLAGHNNINTTTTYLHLSTQHLKLLPLPI